MTDLWEGRKEGRGGTLLTFEVDISLNLADAHILWQPANSRVAYQSLKVGDLLKCGERQIIMASTQRIKGHSCG